MNNLDNGSAELFRRVIKFKEYPVPGFSIEKTGADAEGYHCILGKLKWSISEVGDNIYDIWNVQNLNERGNPGEKRNIPRSILIINEIDKWYRSYKIGKIITG